MRRYILAAFVILFLLEVLPCLLVNFIPTASRGHAAEGATKKKIDNLIADLGSDRFEIREAATRALKERVDALPALRKARQSADLEVRRRAEVILPALERYRAVKELRKAKALGKAGRAVEVADRLAYAAKYGIPGDEGWESLTQLATRVIAPTDRYFPSITERGLPSGWKSYWSQQLPVGEFSRYVYRFNPKEIAESKIDLNTGTGGVHSDRKMRAAYKLNKENDGKFLLRGEEVSLTGRLPALGLRNGMIAASGDVHISGAINSVIVVGGDVKKVERLPYCILICDGDVELLDGGVFRGSIVVARGKVTCNQGEIKDCLVRTGHTLRLPSGETINLKDGTPDPLAFVKFFELADLGITAENYTPREKSESAGVRLTNVRKESPFAAGFRPGDLITALEDKTTPTTEIFRRVLRRKLAEGGPILTFTVRRSGETLAVPLPVKD